MSHLSWHYSALKMRRWPHLYQHFFQGLFDLKFIDVEPLLLYLNNSKWFIPWCFSTPRQPLEVIQSLQDITRHSPIYCVYQWPRNYKWVSLFFSACPDLAAHFAVTFVEEVNFRVLPMLQWETNNWDKKSDLKDKNSLLSLKYQHKPTGGFIFNISSWFAALQWSGTIRQSNLKLK